MMAAGTICETGKTGENPLLDLYFLARVFYVPFMIRNWFSTTYYFGIFGYNRWGPRSRVR
jgi:hypothetical protein